MFYVLCVYGECVRNVRGSVRACVCVSDVAFIRARPFVYRQVLLTLGGRWQYPPFLLSVHAANTRDVPALCPEQVWGPCQ